MKTVDARGLFCPEPVILTKNAVASGEKEIEVLVDSMVCVENVSRFAVSQGYTASHQAKGDEYSIILKK